MRGGCGDGSGLSGGATRLVDAYFTRWLQQTDEGRAAVAEQGFDSAKAALWELLRGGFIALESSGDAITGIRPLGRP